MRLAEKVVPQQLICVGRSLDLFDQMTKETSRMGEVHLVAVIGKNCQEKDHRCTKCDDNQTDRPPDRPVSALAHENAEQSVNHSAKYEAPLIADAGQQDETCKKWADRRPCCVEKSGDSGAVHPIFHCGLNRCSNGWKQDSREKSDGEHQRYREQRDLVQGGETKRASGRFHYLARKEQI